MDIDRHRLVLSEAGDPGSGPKLALSPFPRIGSFTVSLLTSIIVGSFLGRQRLRRSQDKIRSFPRVSARTIAEFRERLESERTGGIDRDQNIAGGTRSYVPWSLPSRVGFCVLPFRLLIHRRDGRVGATSHPPPRCARRRTAPARAASLGLLSTSFLDNQKLISAFRKFGQRNSAELRRPCSPLLQDREARVSEVTSPCKSSRRTAYCASSIKSILEIFSGFQGGLPMTGKGSAYAARRDAGLRLRPFQTRKAARSAPVPMGWTASR